ncbi:hypothetical protein, partial [Nitrosospira sp. Nsp11]|uniref:hypothetical protein n=1 Tax=Nitrosospira sp. Nsp11 TaxID=1855338 RepID=UPI001C49D1EC
ERDQLQPRFDNHLFSPLLRVDLLCSISRLETMIKVRSGDVTAGDQCHGAARWALLIDKDMTRVIF